MAENGHLKRGDITRVQVRPNIYLAKATARQFRGLAKRYKAETGADMTVVAPAGGYRSERTQRRMHAHPEKFNLSTASTVSLAAVGSSTHGFGTRVDIGVGQQWAIDHAKKQGFSREFGHDDPNHFEYDGTTITVVPRRIRARKARPTKAAAKAATAATREIRMFVMFKGRGINNGRCWLIGELTHQKLSTAQVKTYTLLLGKPTVFKDFEVVQALVNDCDARARDLAKRLHA